jgi:alkylation response protein AidB-like acyl-CoA dehydrogenase
MDFGLSRENQMIRDAIRDWLAKECTRELIAEMDERDEFPQKLLRKLEKLGFCGMTVPEEHGGEGRNILGTCIVVEQIANLYPALARCFAGKSLLSGALIHGLGSDRQKEKYLAKCAQGKLMVALAHTQKPGADRPFSVEDNGAKVLLSGEKHVVVNADQAQLLLVSADGGTGKNIKDGPSAWYLMEPGMEGVKVHPVEKVGFKGAKYCTVHFDNVSLDRSDALGGEKGIENGSRVMGFLLLAVAAEALGIAQGAFDYTLKHARETSPVRPGDRQVRSHSHTICRDGLRHRCSATDALSHLLAGRRK